MSKSFFERHNWVWGALGCITFVVVVVSAHYLNERTDKYEAMTGTVEAVKLQMSKGGMRSYALCRVRASNGLVFESECNYGAGTQVTVYRYRRRLAGWDYEVR